MMVGMESLMRMKDDKGSCRKLAFPRLAPAAVRASTSGGELSRFAPFDLTDFLCPTRGPDRAPPYEHGSRVELNPSIQDNRGKGVMI